MIDNYLIITNNILRLQATIWFIAITNYLYTRSDTKDPSFTENLRSKVTKFEFMATTMMSLTFF